MWYNCSIENVPALLQTAGDTSHLQPTEGCVMTDSQFTSCLEIPLTRGFTALVDTADGDLASLQWFTATPRKTPYAVRNITLQDGKRTSEYLHRVILSRILGRELLAVETVDHRDCNSLNNCRDNLRLATRAENNRNTPKKSHNTSGFKGVLYRKGRPKPFARIGHTYLGSFDTPEEAHAAYCAAAIERYGEFAHE